MTATDTIPELIGLARRSGLGTVADRLDYLYHLGRDNGDEPMNSDTVRFLVMFLIEHSNIDTDAITMDPDGFMHVSWSWTQDDILQVQFFPTGNVWFSYFVKESNSGQFKMQKSGEMPPNDMLKTVTPIMNQSI